MDAELEIADVRKGRPSTARTSLRAWVCSATIFGLLHAPQVPNSILYGLSAYPQ